MCNIGPAEIARRRMVGHIGSIATLVLFGVLVVLDAPPIVRLVLALPAAVAASGYIQARMRFCAGFASAGVYDFGEVGPREQVIDPTARAVDRRKGLLIYAASIAIGVAVGIIALLLPV